MAKNMTIEEAIDLTIVEEMRRDSTIFITGWPETKNFVENTINCEAVVKEFGRERVPICGINEAQIAGAGIGAAIGGMRPIIDLQKPDFILDGGLGQIVQQAAQMRSKLGMKVNCPVMFLLILGLRSGRTTDHCGCYYNWMANAPGLFVVMPSMPADARGLLRTILRESKDPVAFFITTNGQKTPPGPVPEGDYMIPFGKADIKREGKNVTIAGVGYSVYLALQAAEELAKEGINAEVWDPRTLTPFDRKSLIDSVNKTGALVVVDQAPKSFGTTAEFMATIAEAVTPIPPMARVASMDMPVFGSKPLMDYILPNKEKIKKAVKDVIARKRG